MATIEKCIRSFKPGSAAGPDKLTPQHLKELLSRQTGEACSRLLHALTSMANVLLSGAIPPQVRPILFGANLIALRKPHGGVRPIAIGNTLRRIVAKAVNYLMFDSFGGKLRPVQLGCGTKAGCEAAVHASRSFLANASEDAPRVLLKLDFQNAFNSVHRYSLLTVVKEDFPHLYPFIWQAYSAPSNLSLLQQVSSKVTLWVQPYSVWQFILLLPASLLTSTCGISMMVPLVEMSVRSFRILKPSGVCPLL